MSCTSWDWCCVLTQLLQLKHTTIEHTHNYLRYRLKLEAVSGSPNSSVVIDASFKEDSGGGFGGRGSSGGGGAGGGAGASGAGGGRGGKPISEDALSDLRSSLDSRFKPHVGTQASRSSFAPYSGRKNRAVVDPARAGVASAGKLRVNSCQTSLSHTHSLTHTHGLHQLLGHPLACRLLVQQ